MRQGSNSRRGRSGRSNGKRPFSQGTNRSIESNGPNVKLRGTAVQVHDKYLTLARDATSSGDRIAAEGYFQHAEHYFRLMSVAREEAAARGNGDGRNRDGETGRGRRGNGRDGESLEAAEGESAPTNGGSAPAAEGEDSTGSDETIN